MPTDDNGIWQEPTNSDRAGRAEAALEAYAQHTEGLPLNEFDGTESIETAVKDLLTDLMHFVGDRDRFLGWMDSAYARYREEVAEEALPVPCAYCGKDTPRERQAAPPWSWPGRGLVTNCFDCAGYVTCTECGTVFDNSEGRRPNCDDCQDKEATP